MRYVLLLAAALMLAACDTGEPDVAEAPVTLSFAIADPGASAVSTREISGPNGILTLDRVALVVAEFELEGRRGACAEQEDGELEIEDCEEFELPPFFADLPLDGGAVRLGVDMVAPGTYSELEFEVENLDDDGRERTVLDHIRTDVADWPEEASLYVEGQFSDGGGSRSFRAFFDAEVEVELELVPPLVVVEGDPATVAVEIDLDLWFRTRSGAVLDLSAFDYDATGRISEFEFERGFGDVDEDDD